MPEELGEGGGHGALLFALLQYQRRQVEGTFDPSGRIDLEAVRAGPPHEDRVLTGSMVPQVLHLGMGEGGTLGGRRNGAEQGGRETF